MLRMQCKQADKVIESLILRFKNFDDYRGERGILLSPSYCIRSCVWLQLLDLVNKNLEERLLETISALEDWVLS